MSAGECAHEQRGMRERVLKKCAMKLAFSLLYEDGTTSTARGIWGREEQARCGCAPKKRTPKKSQMGGRESVTDREGPSLVFRTVERRARVAARARTRARMDTFFVPGDEAALQHWHRVTDTHRTSTGHDHAQVTSRTQSTMIEQCSVRVTRQTQSPSVARTAESDDTTVSTRQSRLEIGARE